MPLDLSGFKIDELAGDLRTLGDILDASGENKTVDEALRQGAVPVFNQMKHNASTDPKKITGNLYESIQTGKPRKSQKSGRRITVGTHKAQQMSLAPHAHLVEFGHGGPAPAPPHPFVRPAFDTQADNAFSIIKGVLATAVDAVIASRPK